MGFAAIAWAILLALPLAADSEGPLANDAFLVVSVALDEELARGDEAWEAAVSSERANDRERFRTVAFEAWLRAARQAQPGDRARYRPGPAGWPDPSGSWAGRLAEGVEEALVRRIAGLPDEDRDAWRRHFEAPSQADLGAAGSDSESWKSIERQYPATDAALRAALVLGDAAFEAGRVEQAQAWWRRAERHAALGAGGQADSTRIRAALERRQRALAAQPTFEGRQPALVAPPGAAEREPAWTRAANLELSETIRLPPLSSGSRRGGASDEPGQGLRPGAVRLADGRFVVHRPNDVVVVEPARVANVRSFEPQALWASGGLPGVRTEHWAAPGTPGWNLSLASDGDLVYGVFGRARRSRGNVVGALRPPGQRGPLQTAAAVLPEVVWAVTGSIWSFAGKEQRPALLASPSLDNASGEVEYQPGPVLAGSSLLVQTRLSAGTVRAGLSAFDRLSGEPLWHLPLAQGADLLPPTARNQSDRLPGLAAEPLAIHDGRVIVGSHLGTVSVVDADGRLLWTLRGRRRSLLDTGWTGSGPIASDSGALWAPHDSDRLYWLTSGPLGATPPFAHPVRARAEAEILLAGDRRGALVLGRAGPYRTLSWLDAFTGARVDSFYLAPRERFGTAALASQERVLFATSDNAYVVDRTRELYLLDALALPDGLSTANATLVPRVGGVALVTDEFLVLLNTPD